MNSNRRVPMTKTKCLFISLPLAFIVLIAASPIAPQKYWVFFRDKGQDALAKGSVAWVEAERRLSPRALARRAKVMPQGRVISEEDLPIFSEYRDELKRRGFEIIHESRWLNGVSIHATADEAAALREWSFVKEVRPVRWLAHPRPQESALETTPLLKTTAHKLDYGASLTQNEQMRVPTLHDAGINGTGVLVGMMDSGFHWQDHEAFQHLSTGVVGERDFVNDDNVTRNENAAENGVQQDRHGTQTLSALAGYKPGQLIGPGFGATFVLAKTENIPTETHAEEDNWAAAIEWMDSLGVDVASSSLGYGKFDQGQGDYTPDDMDGKTTIVTKAAEIAASKGIVVVNSAGNRVDWDIITGPADGEHVIAVGAVNASGNLAAFSSLGPSADGRIKPDVVAMGSGVRLVDSGKNTDYATASGTSFSCPLVGGVVAQILSAHPYLTPAQVMSALRNTASRANSPDNDYGYGIVDARAAITYWGPAFSNLPEIVALSSNELRITVRVLSQFGLMNNQTAVHYAVGDTTSFTVVSMTQVDSISYTAIIPQAAASDTIRLYFSAREINAGTDATYPKNAPAGYLRVNGDGTITGVDEPKLPGSFALLESYPNPVRISENPLILAFNLAETTAVSVTIHNVLGQKVATLITNRTYFPGRRHTFAWDGRDGAGRLLPSGVYFYHLKAGSRQATHKMLLLH